MIYFFRQFLRFLLVAIRYPLAGLSFALKLLEVIPGFRRSVQYRPDRYRAKLQLKENKQSIGHALGDRNVVCSMFGCEFLSFKLSEGALATADQFYLNRPINDAKYVVAMASRFVEICPGDLVFDPGCGAGRHLFHLVDKYQCNAVGVDVYGAAIEVAEVANWDRRVRFYPDSSLDPGLLESVLPQGCDFVFINSWLNHVKDYPGYKEFAAKIIKKCRFLLVINSAKDNLNDLFDTPDILAYDVCDGTQFALIRGAIAVAGSKTSENYGTSLG